MLSSRPVALNLDGGLYKTPGRAITKGRTENDVYHGAKTVNGKGKNTGVGKSVLEPSTLPPQRLFKGAKPEIVLTTRAPGTGRPLGDKTPFPNRVASSALHTPLPHATKLSKLSLLEPGDSVDNLLRPSSTRKNVRVPRSASKSFETPANGGHHWDVSDLSIVMPDSQVALLEEEVSEDDDEIEYMPPKLEIAYEPPFDFDIPDYKAVGTTLFNITHSYPIDDSPQPDYEIDDKDLGIYAWETMALPELEDDNPFQTLAIPTQTRPKPIPVSTVSRGIAHTRAASTASTSNLKSRAISRPGTAGPTATNTISKPSQRPAATAIATRTRAATISSKPITRTTSLLKSSTVPNNARTTTAVAPTPRTTSATTLRRPATSTSVYRPRVTTTKKPVPKPSDMDLMLVVGAGAEVEEDFRFDV